MNFKQRYRKRRSFLLLILYFAVGYFVTNWLAFKQNLFFDVSLGFEKGIPFVPVFIFEYALVYISILIAYFCITDYEEWRDALSSFFVATTTCFVFFVLLPVEMIMRPELSAFSHFPTLITQVFYYIDLPYNCFPSIHVTYSVLAALITRKKCPQIRYSTIAIALIVAISVLLVKQHYIADVVSGIITAVGSYWIASRIIPHKAQNLKM